MNNVQLLGRLTNNPELKYIASEKAVVSFTLAVNRIYGEGADFFDCEAWGKQAELISDSCAKGHRLSVWGRLQQDKWQDKDGQNRYKIKVVVAGFNFIEAKQGSKATENTSPKQGFIEFNEADIPF